MKRLRPFLAALLLVPAACSPEEKALNTAEKREAARRTEERALAMMPELDSLCALYRDSLQPYLIDSLLQVRLAEMAKLKEKQ